MPRVYVHRHGTRVSVTSLRPFLPLPLEGGMIMDADQMERKDIKTCRWLDFGIGKGVTHLKQSLSVFGIPNELKAGLHGDLIQGFDHVDETPRCYDLDALLGFGSFVRWVYFSNPNGTVGVLGIDFSRDMPETGGVATRVSDVVTVARHLIDHGIPEDAELALLNCKMVEDEVYTRWRRHFGLNHVRDWANQSVLAPTGALCPACGSESFTMSERFCVHCGVQARSWRKEVGCGVENRITGLPEPLPRSVMGRQREQLSTYTHQRLETL